MTVKTMNIQQRQVVIIGAGPSGSTAAALLLKQGIDVLVVEKAQFPRFSIGESLLPACMEVVEEAGMTDAVQAAGFQFKNGAAFRKQGVYTEFDFTDKFTPGPGTTFQVQRANFDKVLADSAAEQGVEIRYGHEVLAVAFEGSKSWLTIADELGQPYQVEADYVLDASGLAEYCQNCSSWKNHLACRHVKRFLLTWLIIFSSKACLMTAIKF